MLPGAHDCEVVALRRLTFTRIHVQTETLLHVGRCMNWWWNFNINVPPLDPSAGSALDVLEGGHGTSSVQHILSL